MPPVTLAERRAIVDAVTISCRICRDAFPRIHPDEPVDGCPGCAYYGGRAAAPRHFSENGCPGDGARPHAGCKGLPHCTCATCW